MIQPFEHALARRVRLSYTTVEKPVEKAVENRLSQCKYKHFAVSSLFFTASISLLFTVFYSYLLEYEPVAARSFISEIHNPHIYGILRPMILLPTLLG